MSAKSREEPGENVMIYLAGNGRSFACECGCNVFWRVGALYTCNACGVVRKGERRG